MRKIIFLEFFGVMITDRHQSQLMASGSPLRDEYGLIFDPECVENLKQIVDSTGADIVVISTWKVGLRLKGIRQMWDDRCLPGKVVGVTPNIDPASRGNEIAVWLDAQTDAVRYVIIDDIAFLFREEQMPHLFKVDERTGLDSETAKKAAEYLNLNITEEQKQQLQSITVANGINAWEYVLQQSEDKRYWAAAGILSLQEKGRPINRLTLFWEIEDLQNPPQEPKEPCIYPPSKEVMEKLSEEQRQQIKGLTLHDGMNAWDYVLSVKEGDQYWAAVGILSCVEHGYNLNSLTINWEARELRYKNQTADMRWDSHLQGVYQFAFNYSTGVHPVNYRRLKEIFDGAFTWHEGQVECGYLPSFGGKPYSSENRQTFAQEVYKEMAKVNHRLTDLVERLKVAMDCLGRNADTIELK